MWVSGLVSDVLFKLELSLVAMGWQVWVTVVVSVGLFELELGVVVAEWQVLVSLVSGVLFESGHIVGVVG